MTYLRSCIDYRVASLSTRYKSTKEILSESFKSIEKSIMPKLMKRAIRYGWSLFIEKLRFQK